MHTNNIMEHGIFICLNSNVRLPETKIEFPFERMPNNDCSIHFKFSEPHEHLSQRNSQTGDQNF